MKYHDFHKRRQKIDAQVKKMKDENRTQEEIIREAKALCEIYRLKFNPNWLRRN